MSMICNNCGAAVGREDWVQNEGLCDVCAEKEEEKKTLPSKILSWIKRIPLYNIIRWLILSPFIAVLWVFCVFVIVPTCTVMSFLTCSSWKEFKDSVRQIGRDFIKLRFFYCLDE